MAYFTTQQGTTSASDADTDIALALTFAYGRWQDPKYLAAATRSLMAISGSMRWSQVGSNYYLASNNMRKSKSGDWVPS
jgi:endo-1,4-beta-D-glucanase Y